MEKIENEYVCQYCLNELDSEEIESPMCNEYGEVMCDDCYHNHYELICPVCGDFFEKALKSEDYYFAITANIIDEYGIEYENEKMKPGIYKTLEWPFFYGDMISGFDGFFDKTIELIKEINLSDDGFCEEICYGCVEKHTG